MADDKDNWKLAIAVSIATLFRNTPGVQISRPNVVLYDNFPAFLCKDKRALKNRMKKVVCLFVCLVVCLFDCLFGCLFVW